MCPSQSMRPGGVVSWNAVALLDLMRVLTTCVWFVRLNGVISFDACYSHWIQLGAWISFMGSEWLFAERVIDITRYLRRGQGGGLKGRHRLVRVALLYHHGLGLFQLVWLVLAGVGCWTFHLARVNWKIVAKVLIQAIALCARVFGLVLGWCAVLRLLGVLLEIAFFFAAILMDELRCGVLCGLQLLHRGLIPIFVRWACIVSRTRWVESMRWLWVLYLPGGTVFGWIVAGRQSGDVLVSA